MDTFLTRHRAGMLIPILLAVSIAGIIYFQDYFWVSIVRHWIFYLTMMVLIMISLPPYFLLLQTKNIHQAKTPFKATSSLSKQIQSKQTQIFAGSKLKAMPLLKISRNHRLNFTQIIAPLLPLRKKVPPLVFSFPVQPIPSLHYAKTKFRPGSKLPKIPLQPGERQQRALQNELEDISRRLNSPQILALQHPKTKPAAKHAKPPFLTRNLQEELIEQELREITLNLRKRRKSAMGPPTPLEKQKWDEKLAEVERKLGKAEELSPAPFLTKGDASRQRNITALQKELEKELEQVNKKTKKSKEKHPSFSSVAFPSTELIWELQRIEEKLHQKE